MRLLMQKHLLRGLLLEGRAECTILPDVQLSRLHPHVLNSQFFQAVCQAPRVSTSLCPRQQLMQP